ncbi:MAG: hypothetical protein LBL20_04950 [Treponema sp.]|jgi:hypothetical protein|nr:hypothetical protein [Treponema sp.]
MKKLLFVLLFVSFAGGALVFAEEGFSWDGGVEIGSKFRARDDFTESEKESTDVPVMEPGGEMKGELNLNYIRKGLDIVTSFTGFYGFSDQGSVNIWLETAYRDPGDLFAFCLFTNVINARGNAAPAWFSNGPERLWLYYNLFGGDLRLYGAYRGRTDDDLEEWDDNWSGDWNVSDLVKDSYFNFSPLADAAGLQIRWYGFEDFDFGVTFGSQGAIAGYEIEQNIDYDTDLTRYDFVKGFLLNDAVLGVKYSPDNWAASLMFAASTYFDEAAVEYGDVFYHMYLGGKYDLNSGLGFYGDVNTVNLNYINSELYYPFVNFGIGARYTIGALHAWLDLKLTDLFEEEAALFSVGPRVHYNVIPDTLQIRFPFTFAMDLTNSARDLVFSPALYWNFARNGLNEDPKKDGKLGQNGKPGTGVVFMYNLGFRIADGSSSINKNNFEIIFRVSF